MATEIEDKDLVIHVLNVGQGDTIVLELPAPKKGGRRRLGVVDCYNGAKTRKYLKRICEVRPNVSTKLAFICATHPHFDHIAGIPALLEDDDLLPDEFWDSGFRHKSCTYGGILRKLCDLETQLVRVSSGMEWYFGTTRITALAPSVLLRNTYNTYGVDINNSSIVLRLENHKGDVMLAESEKYKGKRDAEADRKAGSSVVILGGDAEFDSWAQVSEEYPRVVRDSGHDPLVKKMVNPLACGVMKVSHHGSMHSAPLDIYEKMSPEVAIISAKQTIGEKKIGTRTLKRSLFPHQTSELTLTEVGCVVVTTDGSHEREKVNGGRMRNSALAHQGSIVVVVPPGGKARWLKLEDTVMKNPLPPLKV
jgi:beta-lactamase superfamily II metal-dependent hydrolase